MVVEKRRGGQTFYRQEDGREVWLVLTESEQGADKTWTHSCGTDVLSVDQVFSIHDGPFPLSGHGETTSRPVPFCPTCEEAPSRHGGFVTVPFSGVIRN